MTQDLRQEAIAFIGRYYQPDSPSSPDDITLDQMFGFCDRFENGVDDEQAFALFLSQLHHHGCGNFIDVLHDSLITQKRPDWGKQYLTLIRKRLEKRQ